MTDLDRRLTALGDLPVAARPAEASLRTRPPSRRPLLVAAAVVAVLLVAGTVVARRGGDGPDMQTGGFAGPQGEWRTIAPAPLSPRTGASSAWVDGKMLVFGGTDRSGCAPDSVCPGTFRRDAAAYDPASNTWAPIADVPADLHRAQTEVLDDRLAVIGSAPTGLIDLAPPRLLLYTPSTDVWSEGAAPPSFTTSESQTDPNGNELRNTYVPAYPDAVALGRRLYLAAPVQPDADPVDWAYDLDLDRWDAIPFDGLGSASNRQFIVVDGRTFLVAQPDVAAGTPGPTRLGVVTIDREMWQGAQPLDGVSGTGRRWFGAADYAVDLGGAFPLSEPTPVATNPTPGGTAIHYPDRTLEGDVSTVPPAPQQPGGAHLPAIGSAGEWIVPGGPMMYRPSTATWVQVPDLPDPRHRPEVGVWTGSQLIVWGGVVGADTASPVPSNAGAIWTPPGGRVPVLPDPPVMEPVSGTTPGTTPGSTPPPTVPGDDPDAWRDELAGLGIDVAAAPPAVRDLADAESCGATTLRFLEPPADPDGARKVACLADAHLSRQPAALAVGIFTTEGDPVVTVYRTDAAGAVHVFHDATRDAFGSGTWSYQSCGWLRVAATEADGGHLLEPMPDGCGDPEPAPVTGGVGPDFGSRQELPPWVRATEPTIRCGLVVINRGISDSQRSCFSAALAAGTPAELATIGYDDTGGADVRWYRALADGTFEIVRRSSPRPAEDGPWVRERCATFVPAPADAPGRPAPVTATGCTPLGA